MINPISSPIPELAAANRIAGTLWVPRKISTHTISSLMP